MDVSLQNTYGIARRGGGDQRSLGDVVQVREQIPYDVFRLCSLGHGLRTCCSYGGGVMSAYYSYDGGQPSFGRGRGPGEGDSKKSEIGGYLLHRGAFHIVWEAVLGALRCAVASIKNVLRAFLRV